MGRPADGGVVPAANGDVVRPADGDVVRPVEVSRKPPVEVNTKPPVDVSKRPVDGPALERAGSRDPAVARLRAAVVRVPAQVQHTVAEVVRLLAAVVRRLRVPLLVVAAAPLLPAAVLVVAAAVRGGADVPLAYVVAVLLLIPSGWLEVRRRQLLSALQPPELAAAEIYAIVGSPEFWSQLRSNAGELADLSRGLGVRVLARKLWQGVQLTNAVRERVGDNSRLAPFLPGRLRGLLLLTAACGVAGALLTVLAVLKVVTAAIGIG